MGRYCKNCYISNIEFFKNIRWVAIIRHNFLIITQINVIYSICSQSFQFMTLNAIEQLGIKWKSKICTVFIRPAPSLFELMYMLWQNNCVNNGVTNALKRKKQACKTAFYGKIKERRETGVNGSLECTQKIPCLSVVTIQRKINKSQAPIDEGNGA